MGRVVGVEVGGRTLQTDAKAALELLLAQSRAEFERQGLSVLALRSEIQAEVQTTRAYLQDIRAAVEQLYAGAQSEVLTLQQAAYNLDGRIRACEAALASTRSEGGSGGQGPPGIGAGDGPGGGPSARLPQSTPPPPGAGNYSGGWGSWTGWGSNGGSGGQSQPTA